MALREALRHGWRSRQGRRHTVVRSPGEVCGYRRIDSPVGTLKLELRRAATRGGLLVLLWLLSGTASLTAAPLVWHVFSSANPDVRMERILYLSAGVALVEAGYSSVQDTAGTTGRWAYILETEYRLTDASVRVDYALRSADGQELADTTVVADLDVDLDQQIADAVDDLLRDAALPRLESPDAEIGGFGIAGGAGTPEVDGDAPEDSGTGEVTPPPPEASPMPGVGAGAGKSSGLGPEPGPDAGSGNPTWHRSSRLGA